MKLAVTLSLEKAEQIIDSSLLIAKREKLLPLTVVVLDSGGKLIAMKSQDGSGLLRFDVAFGKAWGSLGMGISSRLIRDRLAARPQFQTALMTASGGQVVPVPGGVLIEDANEITIGAVGISGDTSEKDEYCAITAIQQAGYGTEPSQVDVDWKASCLSDTVSEN